MWGITCLFESLDTNVTSNISDRVSVMHAGRIVEVAETNQNYLAPRDPGSSDLLDAVLILELHAQKASCEAVQGQLPNPMDLPPGCAISDRRVFATDKCLRAIPSLKLDGDGRLTACHRRNEVTFASIRARG